MPICLDQRIPKLATTVVWHRINPEQSDFDQTNRAEGNLNKKQLGLLRAFCCTVWGNLYSNSIHISGANSGAITTWVQLFQWVLMLLVVMNPCQFNQMWIPNSTQRTILMERADSLPNAKSLAIDFLTGTFSHVMLFGCSGNRLASFAINCRDAPDHRRIWFCKSIHENPFRCTWQNSR